MVEVVDAEGTYRVTSEKAESGEAALSYAD